MSLNEKRDFYKKWIDAHKKGNKMFPKMLKLLEETERQINIASKIPDYFPELKRSVENRFLNEFEYLNDNIQIGNYSTNFNLNTLEAIATSGSTSGYSEIVSFEPQLMDYDSSWKVDVSTMIIESNESQDNIQNISNSLGTIWAKLKDEFDISIENYGKYCNDILNQSEFGISMRNVVEHINGRLFQAAREIAKQEYQKINKNMKWSRMADFVALNGKDSNEYEELVELHGAYSVLKTKLSNSLKNNRTSTKEEMKEIYAQYIEFFKSIVMLIDTEKINNALQQKI